MGDVLLALQYRLAEDAEIIVVTRLYNILYTVYVCHNVNRKDITEIQTPTCSLFKTNQQIKILVTDRIYRCNYKWPRFKLFGYCVVHNIKRYTRKVVTVMIHAIWVVGLRKTQSLSAFYFVFVLAAVLPSPSMLSIRR